MDRYQNDGSMLSNFIHQSIAQAVNDNSKGKLTFKPLFYFKHVHSNFIQRSINLFTFAISCLNIDTESSFRFSYLRFINIYLKKEA